MAEQEQGSSESQNTSTEGTEQTLDQVYQQFNVEETANQFQPQPVQQAQPAQTAHPLGGDIPDPVLDQAGFKAWQAKQNQELRQALSGLSKQQQQLAVAEARRQEEADIQSAVKAVKAKVGEIDDDFIEIALGQKARKDPKFASLYQNRNKNPQAWAAALNAVSNEMKGKYQFKADPQLAENVRAAKQSTQSSLTTSSTQSENPIQSRLDSAKTPAEWERAWNEMVNRTA